MNKLVFFLLLFTLSVQTYSQAIVTAREFFNRTSDRYADVASFQAEISIKMEGAETMEGRILYKVPNMMRIDFTTPDEQVIVTDGKMLTVYIPNQSVAMMQQLNQRDLTATGGIVSQEGLILLARNYSISYLRDAFPEPLDDNSDEMVTKLRLVWTNTDEPFRELEISIDEDFLIRRMVGITEPGLRRLQFDYYNIQLNEEFPDSRFEYESPKSAYEFRNFLFTPEE